MSYTCDYGHKHRTETAVRYCHVNMPYMEKANLVTTTPWQHEGTTEVWVDLGDFRALFWGDMRSRILKRDTNCQYQGCKEREKTCSYWYPYTLEVHHIVPRRLGGSDHPANLITFCHEHHKIQPAHHYDVGLVLCDDDLETVKHHRIRQARPACETTLADHGIC
jgi:5-methylcytosine-specific restriction endonuclease McrA